MPQMAPKTGFEARFVCEVCNVEILLFADALDATRIQGHAKTCPGTLAFRGVLVDPSVPARDAYAAGLRCWPFAELGRVR